MQGIEVGNYGLFDTHIYWVNYTNKKYIKKNFMNEKYI